MTEAEVQAEEERYTIDITQLGFYSRFDTMEDEDIDQALQGVAASTMMSTYGRLPSLPRSMVDGSKIH